ncbi:hypothetical protein OQA88_3912 [Cercophora sp. LCS_1]
MSPNPSRRASILNSSIDDAPSVSTTVANMPATRSLQAEDILAIERQRAIARESGLKRSLVDLGEFSTSSTKRLDDTYYSVLEKLGTLQSTIIALKELSGKSYQMNRTFSTEAEELVTDVSSQLDAFGQFEDQQQRVEKLQDRIYAGRDKIKLLSKRVDVVRERIESWERADKEWQERTRRRLKAVWVVTSVFVFIILLIFLMAQYAHEGFEETTVRLANESLNTLRDVTGSNLLWAEPAAGSSAVSVFPSSGTESGTSPKNTLKAFDEL